MPREEGMMNETDTMEFQLGWLSALMEDGDAPISEKVDGLLRVLGTVRKERDHATKPMQDTIARQQEIIKIAARVYNEAEKDIKGDLWRILEEFVEGEKHDSDLGRVQIIRPKPRISYDTKGLETLRLSSDEMQRLIGHLRRETTSKASLRVKLK